MKKSCIAFTLAEVLITLLIIGIVASLVIPAIINDSKEAEYNTGVKKAYADLSNALKMIQINNGGVVNVGTGANFGLRNEFCNLMSCVKTDTLENIFNAGNYRFYKGSIINWSSYYAYPAAVLNNGYLINFRSYVDCNQYDVNACGFIKIDINGYKLPNMLGKDLYFFWITKNDNGYYSILPGGTNGDSNAPLPSGCTTGSNSWATSDGCTAKRLNDPDNMP
jgi:type II secretory pathway pseudopilin PulG